MNRPKCFEITCTLPEKIEKIQSFTLPVSLRRVKDLNPGRQDAPLSVMGYGKWNLNL